MISPEQIVPATEAICFVLAFLGLVIYLEKRKQNSHDKEPPQYLGNEASKHHDGGTDHKAPVERPYPTEEQHRAAEQAYWKRQLRLSWLAFAASGVAAFTAAWVLIYTRDAAREAHEQAVQARRQADVAENQLVATTRARLKLTAIAGTYVSRAKGMDVAWFHFKLAYKNFGPSPAESIFFAPHVFVVGAGPSPKQACKTGPGWITHEASTDIIFPQDEGGGSWAVQVPLQKLAEEAAKVLAVSPAAPAYMGVVGCLLYRSGSEADTYVTGFVGDLHVTGPQQDKSGRYIPLYDVLTAGDGPAKIGMEVKGLSAWAD